LASSGFVLPHHITYRQLSKWRRLAFLEKVLAGKTDYEANNEKVEAFARLEE
jgi:hypothetical protein